MTSDLHDGIPLFRHDRDIEYPWLWARLAWVTEADAILDVGCVDGPVLDKYPWAEGFDFRAGAECWGSRFTQGDILKALPYPDGCCDYVVSISTLEHIGCGFYGDPIAFTFSPDLTVSAYAVAEIARVTKPGGVVLVSVPIEMKWPVGRVWYLREPEVRGWFEQAGLDVQEWLLVSGRTWTAAPSSDGACRRVLLVMATKPRGEP